MKKHFRNHNIDNCGEVIAVPASMIETAIKQQNPETVEEHKPEVVPCECSECDDLRGCVNERVHETYGTIFDDSLDYLSEIFVAANQGQNMIPDHDHRGLVAGDSGDLELELPQLYKSAMAIDRINYSNVIDALMELEEMKLDAQKTIALAAKRKELETIFEFNTQSNAFKDSVVMCTIVQRDEPME